MTFNINITLIFRCLQEMLEALKALSVFFTENSLRTRRNLRGDIERRSLTINEEFARIFKEVKEVKLKVYTKCCYLIYTEQTEAKHMMRCFK